MKNFIKKAFDTVKNFFRDKYFLIFLSLTIPFGIFSKFLITNIQYDHTGGDFSSYFFAKVASIENHIDFVHSHFEYDDLFEFDNFEKRIEDVDISGFKKVSVLKKSDLEGYKEEDNILFVVDRYIEEASKNGVNELTAKQVKKISEIKKEFLKDLPLGEFSKKENEIFVVAHIRKGLECTDLGYISSKQLYKTDNVPQYSYCNNVPFFSDFLHQRTIIYENFPSLIPQTIWQDSHDILYTKKPWPLDKRFVWAVKFPPEQYYVDCIKKISMMYPKQRIKVLVVTDDLDPKELIKRIQKECEMCSVKFDYRENTHLPHKQRVAEDLYLMSQAEILIRPGSYFSFLAEFMGDHALVFSPIDARWQDDKLLITTINIKKNFEIKGS